MVKNCDQISCKGCKKLFKPLVFQVHALKCIKLKEEIGEEDTDRLSIKITCKEKDTCNAIVVVAGMRWLAKFSFQDFSGKLLDHLQSEFPQAEVMRGKALTKFRKALQENAPEHEICNTLQELVDQLQLLQVVTQDRRFRELFQISSHLEAAPEEAKKFQVKEERTLNFFGRKQAV